MSCSDAPASAVVLSGYCRTADAGSAGPAGPVPDSAKSQVADSQAAKPAVRQPRVVPEAVSPIFSAIPSDPAQDAAMSQCGLYQTSRSCLAGAALSASPEAAQGTWCCLCSRSTALQQRCAAEGIF